MSFISLIFGISLLVSCTVVDDQDEDKQTKDSEPAPYDLIPAMAAFGWNLFATGDVSLEESLSEGRIAVLGAARLENFAVATIMPEDKNRCDLAVQGDLDFTSGSVNNGRICVVGQFESKNLGAKFPGSDKIGLPLKKQLQEVTELSLRLGQISPLEKVTANILNAQDTYVKLDAQGSPGLVAFQVSPSANPYVTGLEITGSSNGSVVLNFMGDSWDFRRIGVNLAGISATNVIYNFPDATTIVMTDTTLQGTLIAPHANIEFEKSSIIGSIICSSLSGDGRFVLKPFTGELLEE